MAASFLRKIFEQWNRRLPTIGALDFAFFMVAVVSGVILVLPYDVTAPKDSLQVMMLTSQGGVFFRSLHYWSAQAFTVLALLHVIEFLLKKGEEKVSSGLWIRLSVGIPVILYVMLSGFILKGDAEAELARQIFGGLVEALPLLGDYLSFIFLGREGDLQIVYVHHAATATLFTWIIIIEHVKRFWPDLVSHIYAMGLSIVFSVIIPASLHSSGDPVVKGPWYFIGFQEILHWMTRPVLSVAVLVLFLSVFMGLPKINEKYRSRVKIFFSSMLFIYFIFTIIGWAFRGAGWQFQVPWQ